MEFAAEYEPIPNTLNGFATVSLTFLLRSDYQEEFEQQLSATEELVRKIVGNNETLTNGTSVFNTVWSMDALMPTGQTRPINGTYYTQITTTVYVDFSDSYKYTNQYTYYIKRPTDESYIQLKPFNGDSNRNNEENYPHVFNTTEQKGGISTSGWTSEFTIYADNGLGSDMIKELSSGLYDMEKVYMYKEVFPDGTDNEFAVKITSISRPIAYGEKMYVSISLIKSDEEYTAVS